MSILIGGDDETTSRIAFYMLNFRQLCISDSYDFQRTSSGELQLDTKYYSAQVSIKTLDVFNRSNSFQYDNSYEAYIVAVNSIQKFSGKEFLGILRGMDDVTLRLVAFILHDEDIHELNQRKEVLEWCLNNSFEFLEIKSSNPTKGFKNREKDGLPRLMEALENHMWSNLEMKTQSSRIVNQQKPSIDESSTELTSNNTNEFVTPYIALEDSNNTNDNQSIGLIEVKQHDKEEHEMIQATVPIFSEFKSNALDLSDLVKSTLDGKDTDFDEDGMEMFSTLIDQARLMRGKVTNGEISDSERRENAAEMAMRLCSLMQYNDESSEDES